MENETSRIGRFFASINEKLADQVWYQQLKGKWEEADPQSRLYLKFAAIGLLSFAILFGAGRSLWGVRQMRKELAEKSELLDLIQTANDEMRRLRDLAPNAAAAAAVGSEPWPGYLEATAAGAGVDRANLTVNTEKPGATSDLAKESLYDVAIRNVNIKQVVRFAFQLENGTRPVKVRNLSIDTKNDMTGFLDATISVSAFAPKDPAQ